MNWINLIGQDYVTRHEYKGYSIAVDWSNYARLCGEVKGVPDRFAELIALSLEGNLKSEAPVGKVGFLHGSFRTERRADAEYVVGSPAKYATYVNDGTRPHVPPIDAIKDWAEFRGLPWYPIWRSICLRGTQANPYIERALETTNREVPLCFNRAFREKVNA